MKSSSRSACISLYGHSRIGVFVVFANLVFVFLFFTFQKKVLFKKKSRAKKTPDLFIEPRIIQSKNVCLAWLECPTHQQPWFLVQGHVPDVINFASMTHPRKLKEWTIVHSSHSAWVSDVCGTVLRRSDRPADIQEPDLCSKQWNMPFWWGHSFSAADTSDLVAIAPPGFLYQLVNHAHDYCTLQTRVYVAKPWPLHSVKWF